MCLRRFSFFRFCILYVAFYTSSNESHHNQGRGCLRSREIYMAGWLVVLVFYGSSTHFRSFRARSVNLATLFLGKPPRQFTSA